MPQIMILPNGYIVFSIPMSNIPANLFMSISVIKLVTTKQKSGLTPMVNVK